MTGQINIGTPAGDLIADISKRSDVSNIVEIGTWNGMGSTLCVIKGIIQSKVSKNFISLELYEEMYNKSLVNLKDKIQYVKLLNGKIISYEEAFGWFDHSIVMSAINDGLDRDGISSLHSALWFERDMTEIRNAKNVMVELPEKIDFLILDGGEYTSYPEWIKLKDRTRIVALDDSNIFKCSRIRSEILNSGEYTVIYDDLSDRNGFEKK